jgi:hypothetical protein
MYDGVLTAGKVNLAEGSFQNSWQKTLLKVSFQNGQFLGVWKSVIRVGKIKHGNAIL